jgi:hypothetical protein
MVVLVLVKCFPRREVRDTIGRSAKEPGGVRYLWVGGIAKPGMESVR